MKAELFRFSKGIIKQERSRFGPYEFRFYAGEFSGIITEEIQESRIIIDFLRGKNQMIDGYLYLQGQKIDYENLRYIKKIFSKHLSVISGNSGLVPGISIIDNIFLNHIIFYNRKNYIVAKQIMEYLQFDINLKTRVDALSALEKIQIEIVRAVIRHQKMIFLEGVLERIHKHELSELLNGLRRLTKIGYSVCFLESIKNIPLNNMDRLFLVEMGKSINSYLPGEIDYYEITNILQTYTPPLLENKINRKTKECFKLKNFNGQGIDDFPVSLRQGMCNEIICKTKYDYNRLYRILNGQIKTIKCKILISDKWVETSIYRGIKKFKIGILDYGKIDEMLFDNLSVLENLCYPLSLRTHHFYLHPGYKKAIKKYLSTFIKIDNDMRVNNLPHRYVQKLAFCKWVLCKPEILVVFVPSTYIEEQMDGSIKKIVNEICNKGTSILFVTEHYAFESNLINSYNILKHGKWRIDCEN